MKYNAIRIFLSIFNPATGYHLHNTFTVPDDVEAIRNNYQIFRESNPDCYVTITYFRPGKMPKTFIKLPVDMEADAMQVSEGRMSSEEYTSKWYAGIGKPYSKTTVVEYYPPLEEEEEGEPDWSSLAQQQKEEDWYID